MLSRGRDLARSGRKKGGVSARSKGGVSGKEEAKGMEKVLLAVALLFCLSAVGWAQNAANDTGSGSGSGGGGGNETGM